VWNLGHQTVRAAHEAREGHRIENFVTSRGISIDVGHNKVALECLARDRESPLCAMIKCVRRDTDPNSCTGMEDGVVVVFAQAKSQAIAASHQLVGKQALARSGKPMARQRGQAHRFLMAQG